MIFAMWLHFASDHLDEEAAVRLILDGTEQPALSRDFKNTTDAVFPLKYATLVSLDNFPLSTKHHRLFFDYIFKKQRVFKMRMYFSAVFGLHPV